MTDPTIVPELLIPAAKVPAKLEVRKGKGHGWPDVKPDVELMLKWFDDHLGKATKDKSKARKDAFGILKGELEIIGDIMSPIDVEWDAMK